MDWTFFSGMSDVPWRRYATAALVLTHHAGGETGALVYES
jgi:hypothetical protein